MGKIKRSYGIICCRRDPTYGLQIILIKKPITYHFCEFVSGHYRKADESHLRKLFNNMTYHEKMDILSLKFSAMWYRIYRCDLDQSFIQSNSNQARQYLRNKAKFETTFLQDGGNRLKQLMADTVNAETLWEIPKGRKQESSGEDDINTAIREFSEETLIKPSSYTILWHIKPYIETYADFGVTYQNIFYYANAAPDLEPAIKFSNGRQIAEVSAIRWCGILDIINMKLEKGTYQRLLNMFRKVSKKYKNKNRLFNLKTRE